MSNRNDPRGKLADILQVPLNELANKFMEQTGRVCLKSLTLSKEAGLMFGMLPGETFEAHTSCGMVKVCVEDVVRCTRDAPSTSCPGCFLCEGC